MTVDFSILKERIRMDKAKIKRDLDRLRPFDRLKVCDHESWEWAGIRVGVRCRDCGAIRKLGDWEGA